MNAMGLVQSKCRPSTGEKNEIRLFYLYFNVTSFLFIICEVFMKIL